jgi:CRISPR/Cas system-associated exonuclease Cas4 (RecB family)
MELRELPRVAELYEEYSDVLNQENKDNRYGPDKRSYYHASSADLCIRKHWFATHDITETDPPDTKSKRVLRLGTVMHKDFEMAFSHFNRKKKAQKERQGGEGVLGSIYSTIKNIRTEGEVILPELNVRGHYDALFEMENGEFYLYDFKTISAYGYKKKFGRYENRDTDPPMHHELQLATYGIALQKEYGRLDGMFLYYYNKDNSMCRQIEVKKDMFPVAIDYWRRVLEAVDGAEVPPPVNGRVSPHYSWECNYCNYMTYCGEYDLLDLSQLRS